AVQDAYAVHRHHAQSSHHDRGGRRGLRRDDAGAGRVIVGQRPDARRAVGGRDVGRRGNRRRGTDYGMMQWRRFAALALVSTLLAGGARMMSAQEITIRVVASADSISPAPVIEVQGAPVPIASQPSTVTLELSRESLFRSPFLVRTAAGAAASF